MIPMSETIIFGFGLAVTVLVGTALTSLIVMKNRATVNASAAPRTLITQPIAEKVKG